MDGALSDLLEAAFKTIDACGEPCRRGEMDRDYFARALGALCPDAVGGLRSDRHTERRNDPTSGRHDASSRADSG
jgi:hypothetical protein